MVLINNTIIGTIILTSASTTTGSLFVSLLIVLLGFLLVCMLFNIPIEYSLAILLPYCIASGAYYSDFVAPLSIILIMLSIVIMKNFPTN